MPKAVVSPALEAVQNASNQLCNALDRYIVAESKNLSGRPFSKRTVALGYVGSAFELVSSARQLLADAESKLKER